MSKDLKKRGWRFVGPTTVYAFMQAMGWSTTTSSAARTPVRGRAALVRPARPADRGQRGLCSVPARGDEQAAAGLVHVGVCHTPGVDDGLAAGAVRTSSPSISWMSSMAFEQEDELLARRVALPGGPRLGLLFMTTMRPSAPSPAVSP